MHTRAEFWCQKSPGGTATTTIQNHHGPKGGIRVPVGGTNAGSVQKYSNSLEQTQTKDQQTPSGYGSKQWIWCHTCTCTPVAKWCNSSSIKLLLLVAQLYSPLPPTPPHSHLPLWGWWGAVRAEGGTLFGYQRQ